MRRFIALIAALTAGCDAGTQAVEPRFRDVTATAGLDVYSPTFGAAFTDIDNDGDDDVLVSNHARGPALYLQTGDAQFVHAVDALPELLGDLHGVSVADFDNDGDRDIVIACGGDDGVGAGCTARTLENRLADDGRLTFADVSATSGLAEFPEHRSRTFLQTLNREGSRIDLYLTGKQRDGFENRFYRNTGGPAVHFDSEPTTGLGGARNSEGRDAFFDFDRDGDRDLLFIDGGSLVLFASTDGELAASDIGFEIPDKVESVAVGDLDNDGFPDVFAGTAARRKRHDRVSHDSDVIHFFMTNDEGDDRDEIRFKTPSERILIDFVVKPGLLPNDPSTIFLGASKQNPWKRRSRVNTKRAAGAPKMDRPGTYIWHAAATNTWHVAWHYRGESNEIVERGAIHADGVTDVNLIETESYEPGTAADVVFWNDGGSGFTRDAGLTFEHSSSTTACRMVDLDNDGRLDIVALRSNPPVAYNGEPFVAMNVGGRELRLAAVDDLQARDDDLFMLDQLATGFANDDGLVDIFVTNGAGLSPGNRGPYKLYVNTTPTSHHFVILTLTGTQSNRDALGAQVELRGANDRLVGYRELGADFNRSQPSHKLHFGLGNYDGAVAARVRWPSGGSSEHPLTIDDVNALTEPSSP